MMMMVVIMVMMLVMMMLDMVVVMEMSVMVMVVRSRLSCVVGGDAAAIALRRRLGGRSNSRNSRGRRTAVFSLGIAADFGAAARSAVTHHQCCNARRSLFFVCRFFCLRLFFLCPTIGRTEGIIQRHFVDYRIRR